MRACGARMKNQVRGGQVSGELSMSLEGADGSASCPYQEQRSVTGAMGMGESRSQNPEFRRKE